MENTKRNPSTRRAAGASEFVIVGRRDDQKFIRPLTIIASGNLAAELWAWPLDLDPVEARRQLATARAQLRRGC